ncbi:MAG: hypothetical protein H0W70_02410 [Actinobacteria bacterium]|nr:hypothetical protein [Actinomycetota bacterium]
MRRLITATGAGLAALALAILFGFAGIAGAQGSGSGATTSTVVADTTTTAFTGATTPSGGLANTGAETWLLVAGAGAATAGAIGARRVLRNRA